MPKQSREADLTAEARPARFRLPRLPWIPVLLSLAVVVTAGIAIKPVRDVVTLREVSEAYLARPVGYVAMAPISAVLDTVTLLSVQQHIAFVVGIIVLVAAYRVFRMLRGDSSLGRNAFAIVATLVSIVGIYLAVAVLPRPMASLQSHDPTIMRIDFHSHTSASADARSGFTEEKNRAWHRAGGYDVAFITDHASVEGAERGIARNPLVGFDNVVLLQGIEVTWTGEHVGILGAERTYRGILTPNRRDVDVQGLTLASVVPTREPIVIWHHPRDLTRLPAASGPSTAGVRALEISNGSPDGMDDVRPRREAILALAERGNLALTTGSDNHGWGRTAPNWTLMRPSNWRGLNTDELARLIERTIRDAGVRSTRVVERVVATPGENSVALALTVVAVPARMLTTLSPDERIMWLVWIWGITAAVWWIRRARRRRTEG